MSSYVPGIPAGMSGNVFRDYLLEKPKLLLDFLNYPRREGQELSDKKTSDKLEPEHGCATTSCPRQERSQNVWKNNHIA